MQGTTCSLFATVEAMLAPEALTELTGMPIRIVRQTPLQADYAKSGSPLLQIDLNEGQGPALILKRVSPSWDWLMRATDDRFCRAVALWQHGLLQQAPAEIDHAILACAHDGDGWALLMRDVSSYMLPYRPFTAADHRRMLDAMASLHASFFANPKLLEPALGLSTLEQTYHMFSPETGQREVAGIDEVPKRILEGWGLLPSLVPADVTELLFSLLADPAPLCRALRRYPQTLIHGDWRHANVGLPQADSRQVILLDWQLAAAAPPSVELGRYLGTNSALLPESKEESLAYYERQLAQRLGAAFERGWWEPQLALGLLGGFLQDGWAIVLKATHWHIGAGAREHWRADIAWWTQQVRAGMKWL